MYRSELIDRNTENSGAGLLIYGHFGLFFGIGVLKTIALLCNVDPARGMNRSTNDRSLMALTASRFRTGMAGTRVSL